MCPEYTQEVWKWLAEASTLSVSEAKNSKEILISAMRKQDPTGIHTSETIRDNLEEWLRKNVGGLGQIEALASGRDSDLIWLPSIVAGKAKQSHSSYPLP